MDQCKQASGSRSHENLSKKGRERTNTIKERLKFNSCEFTEGQTIDNYFNRLKQLASTCEFGDEAENLIRDKILKEINDAELVESLSEEPNLTLHQILDFIRAKKNVETTDLMDSRTSRTELDIVIDDSLRDGLSLNEVETLLETKFTCKLSQYDRNYIERKYVDTLIELWLDEASENVLSLFDPNKPFQLFDKLCSIDSLIDCFGVSENLTYNNLMRELSKTSKYMTYHDKKYILKFKTTAITYMLLKTSYLENEINFLQSFIKAMKFSRNVQEFCNSFNTSFLSSVDNETDCFKTFLGDIVNCDIPKCSIIQLKKSARAILEQDKYFFISCLKDSIESYLRPVNVSESLMDGRKLLEVTGKHIVLSEVLPEIERTPRFCEIEEVRFVNGGAIHIDENLNVKIWHGKNIVVYVETLIVSTERNIIWDVSGENAEVEKMEAAGTECDGSGLVGADGKPGESGGNVLLICDEIENGSNLKVVSNGGKGGIGQDGGNGRDGKDGDSIGKIDFLKKFPPVSKWRDKLKQERLRDTMTNVEGDIDSVQLFLVGTLTTVSLEDFIQTFQTCVKDLTDVYFEVKTLSGCQITFSFYYGPIFTYCQSFLLYKGSAGELGKDGGKGGIGGKGGFAGDIEINRSQENSGVVLLAAKGEDGKQGKSGVCGKPGKAGLDCAYMDCTKWSDPKYFLPHSSDCFKLNVKYHKESGPERVYCSHNGSHAEITKIKKEFIQSCTMSKMQNQSTTVTESQYKVQVTRKKTINPQSIMEQYDHKTSIVDYNRLNSSLVFVKQMYEEIINDETLLEEEIVKESTIIRKVDYFSNVWYEIESRSCTVQNINNKDAAKETLSVIQLIQLAKICPTDPSVWNSLTHVRLNLHDLNTLWDAANDPSILAETDEWSTEIQTTFCSKYQLAGLEHIETLCFEQNSSGLSDNNKTNSKWVESTQNCLTIPNKQEPYSAVEGYLCEDSVDKRNAVIRNLDKLGTDESLWMDICNQYLDSECESVLPHKELSAYMKHYNWFRHRKAKHMQMKLLPILNELQKTQCEQIYNKLVKALTEQNTRCKIEAEHDIQKETFLKAMYKEYIVEVNKPFVWRTCLIPRENLINILKTGYFNDIIKKGPFSVFYRELLAYLFKTNILVYRMNECDQMILVSNHNPSAQQVVHILMKNQCFLKLKINEDLAKMIELHKDKGDAYNKILLNLDSFVDKSQIDQFISNISLALDRSDGIDKSEEIAIKVSHMLMEDENILFVTECFESDEDKQLIECRLQMLKHEYIGYHNALYYLALHMRTEGNHVTAQELCCVINCILKSVVDVSSSTAHLVSWIIAANPQTNWLQELLLLQLELYLKKPLDVQVKKRWRNYLDDTNKETLILIMEKISGDQNLVNEEGLETILFLLSQIPSSHIGLPQLGLADWKYYLKGKFWACQFKQTGVWSEEHVKLASFYLVVLENLVGMDKCFGFIKALQRFSNDTISEVDKGKVLNTLKLITNKETVLSEKLLLNLLTTDICQWEEEIAKEWFCSGEERSLEQLVELIENSSNTSENILSNLNEIIKSIKITNSLCNVLNSHFKDLSELKKWISSLLNIFGGHEIPLLDKANNCVIELNVHDEIIQVLLKKMKKSLENKGGNQDNPSLSDFLKHNLNEVFLATICTAIKVACKITLRNTQKLAIMTFLKTSENVLGQVSTGEGKSFIILSVAIMKALSGCKIDIITSSHVLAKRDATATHYKDIYSMFGLGVGHNCSDDIEERKKTYSNCCIVYGDLANFQRDFLLDRVYDKNILGDRTYGVVLVDEVDSMLLDKANNVLYLSHDIPGLDKLETLFVFIWKWLNMPSSTKYVDVLLNINQLKNKIMYEMYGIIKKEDIRDLDTRLGEQYVIQTWAYLEEERIIDSSGKVLLEQSDESKLYNAANSCIYGNHIKCLLKKVIAREKEFEIPNYLKSFVEDHVEQWIESAINAMNLKNNVDYVIDVNRTGESTDRNPNIIIVDRDTGTDMVNSQWDQGLHQFLQLKHGCRLSPLTFKAVFISNVSYLKMYKKLYGLTGTLGSIKERDLLKEIYNVDFVTIPTAKVKSFTEEITILCSSIDEWLSKIFEEVYKVTENRSALVICETVSDVLLLKKTFDMTLENKSSKRKIHTYTRDYEEFDIADGLDPGHIILSTNLAGRGTDIKLSKQLVHAGGLHVCVSSFPSNCRILEQAFGRAARNGEPGTGQLIFKNLGQSSVSKVVDLMKERDINELFRITYVNEFYQNKIKLEETWFKEFQEKYNILKGMEQDSEIKSILLMTCLDQWAFWLEKNTSSKYSVSIDVLTNNITKLCSEDFNKWSNQIQDPFQLIKLGVLFLKEKENKKALLLFDRVIKEEPFFCEAAHYYRVCARASENDLKAVDLISELENVERILKMHVEYSSMSAHFIDWLKNYNSKSIVQIDSFKEQQQILSETYNIFLESIHRIIGHSVTPRSFLQPTVFDEEIISIIFNDLIEKRIIKQQIKDGLTEKDLQFVKEYGMPPQSVKNILENHKDSNIAFENTVLKCLETSDELPSRELFWNELVSAGILKDEENYAFVNKRSLNKIDPSLKEQITNLDISINPNVKNRLSLYLQEELEQTADDFDQHFLLYLENSLKNKIGTEKLEFLKQENVIILNKQASLMGPIKDVELKHFDSLTIEDFQIVGISSETADCIIDDLIKQQVIAERKKREPTTQYSLLIDSENIEKIELETHKAYSDDVKALLLLRFTFRIALQKLSLVLPLCEGNYNSLCLPLRSKLHESLWHELQERGIIKRTVNNDGESNSSQLQDLYSASMNVEGYRRIFSKIYDKTNAMKIVGDLIKQGWLQLDHLKTLSSTERAYKVNMSKNVNGTSVIKKQKELSLAEHDTRTIELILLNHMKLSDNMKLIEDRLEYFRGSINFVDTPIFSLRPLVTVLKESQRATTESTRFSLNGFDNVIFVEEKKWTWKMKRNVFAITMLGLAQIAVGVVLEFLFLGAPFLYEGMNDLIFVTRCMYSGHFSWRSYITNKILSLITTGALCYYAVSSLSKSTLGSKTTGMSLQSLKEKCMSLFGKAKSAVGRLFQTSGSASKTEIITHMCKRVVAHTAEGVAFGAVFSVVDHIDSQVNNMGETLADLIYSDVNSTVIEHAVLQSTEELFRKLGKIKAQNIIGVCLHKIVLEYQNKLDKSLTSLKGMITTLIGRIASKGFKKVGDDNMARLIQIAEVTGKIVTTFRTAHIYWKDMLNIVSEILDKLQQELQRELITLGGGKESSKTKATELDDFKWCALEELKKSVRSVISEHISKQILSPVLHYASEEYLMKLSSQMISKGRRSFFTDEEVYKFTKNKRSYLKNQGVKGTRKNNEPDFFNSEFNSTVCALLKTRRNKKVLSYLVYQNAPLDIHCIEVCCKIIPLALREEGIHVPSLKVVVEKNNRKYIFSTGETDAGTNTPTVHIAPDADLGSNLRNNKVLVKDLFEYTCQTLQKHYPEYSGLTTELLQLLVVRAIDHFCDSSFSNVCGSEIPTSSSIEVSRMNKQCEKKNPYQHSHYDGGWVFSPHVDVDLREKDQLVNLISVQSHVLKGFETALGMINNNIRKIQSRLRYFNLVLDDFAATKHQFAPPADKMAGLFQCYTVQYDLVVPLMLEGPDKSDILVDFSITMSLRNENAKGQPKPHSPHGPHIVYEMNPMKNPKFLNRGVKGHILLNIDCTETSYGIKECHVAGELITTSELWLRESSKESEFSATKNLKLKCETSKKAWKKEREVLVIGDSILTNIHDNISSPNYETKDFPHIRLSKIESKVMSVLKSYSGIKCVVVYFGTDLVNSSFSPDKIVKGIFDVIDKMLEEINNVTVVMCTLTNRKPPAENCNEKIKQINQKLNSYCKKKRLVLLETNKIIHPKDLGRDGIHLNRGGYHKLGQGLSEVVENCTALTT